jgi:hypothetical protein
MVLGVDGSKNERTGLWSWFRDLERLLSGDLTGVPALRQQGIGISPWRLSVCIIILAMIYGVCMGLFAAFGQKEPRPIQILASMVKVPLLFYLTLLVTLPSLYVFSALVGSRLTFSGVVRLLIASLGVNVTVLASLGPIVAFFSVCTTSYPFMLLFNVVVFAVGGAFGLRFLLQTLRRLSIAGASRQAEAPPSAETQAEAEPAGPLDPVRNREVSAQVTMVFRVWVIVFGLVGAQMGWVLRPFIGNPSLRFSFFRSRESNFFMAVYQALANLFS